MQRTDARAFTALLLDVHRLLARGSTPALSDDVVAMWFRTLAAYPLDAIRAAFDAHVKDSKAGRFVPVPADILAQLEQVANDDGRPQADEAWAIALQSRDEGATVVWTDEASQAFAIARPVLDGGDEVGARMSFRQAYDRLVAQARDNRRPATWTPTLGTDPQRRHLAIAAAIDAGRLPGDPALLPGGARAALELGGPRVHSALAIAGAEATKLLEVAVQPDSGCPPDVLERLRAIADEARAARENQASPDAVARERTRQLQDETARRLEELEDLVEPEAMQRADSSERRRGSRLLEHVRQGGTFRAGGPA